MRSGPIRQNHGFGQRPYRKFVAAAGRRAEQYRRDPQHVGTGQMQQLHCDWSQHGQIHRADHHLQERQAHHNEAQTLHHGRLDSLHRLTHREQQESDPGNRDPRMK